MAFLQPSDIVFNYNMQGVSTVIFNLNRRMHSTGPSLAGGLATPSMDTAVDVTANFLNTDRGYRDSYGRYYEIVAETDHMWLSDTADLRALWEEASFTYGFVFRDTSATDSVRGLISKPSTAGGTHVTGIDLGTAGDGTLIWTCHSDTVGLKDVAIIGASDYEKDVWYVGYVIKADGVQSKIGIKKKGSSPWITANSGGTAVTPDYDNAKNAALLGIINSQNGDKQTPWIGDLQRFCMWDVAITESTVQSSLEDHFGRADTIVAVQRSAILS